MAPPTTKEIEEANRIHVEMFGFRSLDELHRTVGPSLERHVRTMQRHSRGFVARAKCAHMREEKHFGSFTGEPKLKKKT